MLYTCTFTCSPFYEKAALVPEQNRRLCALTRQLEGDFLVAGDLATAGRGDYSYAALLAGYRAQARALWEAGCDFLVAETLMGQQEALAVLEAARSVCDLPVLCTFSAESDGALYFGGDLLETVQALEELGVDAVGLNCGSGPSQMLHLARLLRAHTHLPLTLKPNAGLPTLDAQGQAVYSMDPQHFAAAMRPLLPYGDAFGGCCGTTPEHLAALQALLRQEGRLPGASRADEAAKNPGKSVEK